MYAVEFEADVENGIIKIPDKYKKLHARHIKIIALLDDSETINVLEQKPQYSDEYLKQNWRELMMTGLRDYDEDYYKSDQYKEDRGSYLMEKYQ